MASSDELSTFKAALTEEVLTSDNEPSWAVTKDLKLDLADRLTIPTGATLSFSSTDETVLKNDGTVTRHATQKKTVTLTATLSKGNEELSKDLCFTVLPKTSELVSSDNLYYPSLQGKTVIDWTTGSSVQSLQEWTYSVLDGTVERYGLNASFTKNDGGNDIISAKRVNETVNGTACETRTYLMYQPKNLPSVLQEEDDKSVTITLNVTPKQWGSFSDPQFYVIVNGEDSSGEKLVSYIKFLSYATVIATKDSNEDKFTDRSHSAQAGKNYKIEIKIDYNSQKMYLTLNGDLLNPEGTVIKEGAYTKQLTNVQVGCFRQMKDSVLEIDDICITRDTYEYKEKAKQFAELVTTSALTSSDSFDLNENSVIDLNAPFDGYDLETEKVSVSWKSSNPSVISDSGVVTQSENVGYAELTATLTAGEGTLAAKATKTLVFTVAPKNTQIFDSCRKDFDAAGAVSDFASGNGTPASTASLAELDGDRGNAFKVSFTGTDFMRYAPAAVSSHDKRYFVSADVRFDPLSESTAQYFELDGADVVTRIGLNFQNGGVRMSGNNTEYEYMVPGIEAKTGEWYHIDIDFNSARKCFTAYINGQPINAEPLDVNDNIWPGMRYIREIGVRSQGAGDVYLDNLLIRESNYAASPYDSTLAYSIRKMWLTNETGKTVTNPSSTATSISANVKLIKNKDKETADVADEQILFVRYKRDGRLAEIVSKPIETSHGAQLATIPMDLTEDGDCSGDIFKIFVMNKMKLMPYCASFDSSAPKFDAERLLNKAPNVQKASELGYRAESEYETIEAIIYDGDTYQGRQTKHFAYVGLPEGASAEHPVPAVVCVHGGGGTAFDEWVKKWNDHGYAAIAMNLNGRIPQDSISNGNNQLRHAWAGATQDSYGMVSPTDETWMYSAVTAVIAAHNVLREMDEVDNEKIGIIGVSWGGVVTSTAIGVDQRFKFAIPSYGSGFLYGSETYMGTLMTEEKLGWEPSRFVAEANLPILWMNGETDGNFSLSSTTKSSLLAGENSYTAIIPGFGHDHSITWNREECYRFADSIVGDGSTFVRGSATREGNTVSVVTNVAAKTATLRYSKDNGLTYDSTGRVPQYTFSGISSDTANSTNFNFTLPEGTTMYYITFADAVGNATSTVLYYVSAV